MSRTAWYKLVYFSVVGGGTALALYSIWHFRIGPRGILLGIVLGLIPGRVLGYYWRNLLRGLRLLREKQFEESKRHSELFLTELKQRPWMRKLIWLGTGSYSRKPEAMALNNLGAAELGLGEFESARTHLKAAIAVDERCPLPYFNLGVIASAMGESQEALAWYEQAAALGYSRDAIDRVIGMVQGRFARTDGRGSA